MSKTSEHQSAQQDEISLAKQTADSLAERLYSRDLQLRRVFLVVGASSETSAPPLAQMLRGGRGGEVRLKLYLSLLWTASGEGHDVSLPARVWATLLGLPQPDTNGARRIRDALQWLARHGYVTVHEKPGIPSTVKLLEESGLRRPYTVPGARAGLIKTSGGVVGPTHLYMKVPPTLWTQGWLAKLTGRGLATFLILWNELTSRAAEEVWLSPALATERYALSEDTRYRGLAELDELGLVEVGQRPVSNGALGMRRLRNTYRLSPDALSRGI